MTSSVRSSTATCRRRRVLRGARSHRAQGLRLECAAFPKAFSAAAEISSSARSSSRTHLRHDRRHQAGRQGSPPAPLERAPQPRGLTPLERERGRPSEVAAHVVWTSPPRRNGPSRHRGVRQLRPHAGGIRRPTLSYAYNVHEHDSRHQYVQFTNPLRLHF